MLFQAEMRSEGSQARWRYERMYPVDPGKPLKHFIGEVAKSQNSCNAARYGLVGSKDWNEAGRPVERLF